MKSKAGSILALIGGIFTFIGAILFLFLAVFAFSFSQLGDKIGGEYSSTLVGVIFFVLFFALLAGGIFKVYASRLMKNSKTTLKGGIIALVAGVIVSDIFSLIGGILGIIEGGR